MPISRRGIDDRDVLPSTVSGVVVHLWALPAAPQCHGLIDAARRSIPRMRSSEHAGGVALDADRPPEIAGGLMGGEPCTP